MAHNTVEAFDIVRRLDRAGKVDDSLHGKKQKAATALSRDELQKQDFAKPVSLRLSRILGPISRFRIAQNMPQMSRASRASRSRITLGPYASTAMVCVRHKDYTLRETHRGVEPLLYNFFASVWRQTTVPPRRSHLFHDLITQVFLRSLQYGIVVMGVIDAFVYAHIHHRRHVDNPGNVGDCMKGRIRFMTEITPAYAHAFQLLCLTVHIPAALHSRGSSTCCQSQISAPPQYSKRQ